MDDRIIVHLIHGTWGRGFGAGIREGLETSSLGRSLCRLLKPPSRAPYWFESESSFCERVLEKIDPALRDRIEFRRFLWSGSNSFRARTFAADGLRVYLRGELEAAPGACHLLVTHSHGGNVAVEAVTAEGGMGSRPVDGILSMATPYLALEADTANSFNLLMHGLLPVAIGLYFLALVALLAAARSFAAAGWLGATIFGLLLGLKWIPALAHRAGVCRVLDVCFALACAAAVWCAFQAAFAWVPASHPADSSMGIWERAARYGSGLLASMASLLMLLGARAAGVAGRLQEGFLLRDTVEGLLALVAGIVILASFTLSYASSDPWFNGLAIFAAFWPFLTLFLASKLEDLVPVISRRSVAVWRREAEEQSPPALPCPLEAVRLPGDEATLAIVASQLARDVSSVPGAAINAFSRMEDLPGWMKWLLGLLLAAGVATGIRQLQAGGVSGWPAFVFGPILGAAAVLMMLFAGTLLLLAGLLCFSLLTFGLLAVAVGPEVLGLLPAVRLDCEPLPRCQDTGQCSFALHWVTAEERSRLALRHSMYELEPVQERVARWIERRAGLTRSSAGT